MLGLLLARIIINVGEGIELVGHNVDIVAADAMTLAGDALAFIHTSDGVELAARNLALL